LYTTPDVGNHKLLAALSYARRGVPVFPCAPGDKAPLTERGFYDATTAEEQIREWWRDEPEANIGIPTGPASGIWALDVDAHSYGFTSLDDLTREHGELPSTTTTRTGGGGMHMLFRFPTDESISNSAGKIGMGLDVRGAGGYIIAPPSRTESPYEWLERAPLAEAPAWLLEIARRPSKTVSTEATPSAQAEIADGKPIPFGRRNRTLFEHACSMRARGHDQAKILAELRGINAEYCEPPLGDAELRTIAASAARYEIGHASTGPSPEAVEALCRIETELMRREWHGMGELSARDVYVALIWLARKYGRAIPSGIRVQVSERALALLAAVSKRTVQNAIRRLREAGLVRRDGNSSKGLAGAFVLVRREAGRAKVAHSTSGGEAVVSGIPLRAPRLRWSSPEIRRLGKTCGAVVDMLEAAGGSATLEEIASVLHKSRPRDLRRRVLPRLLEAAVVECDGETYRLTTDWLVALDQEREIGGEIAAERRDRDRYAREREAYAKRQLNKPDQSPAPGEIREFRESYPERRREAIEQAVACLFAERPESRSWRVGQITCGIIVSYLGQDFPRGPDGMPKDAEVEAVLRGGPVAA
jgi:hypothetical protein